MDPLEELLSVAVSNGRVPVAVGVRESEHSHRIVAIERRTGRYGWSGGLGTDFVIDPRSGAIGILLI